APRRPELQLVAVADPAGEVDQLAHRDAERGLELAGVGHVPGEAEDAEARGLLGPHPLEPLGPLEDDARHRGDRLDVVDRGRSGVEPRGPGERRLEAGLPATTLERVEERGLLAADVGARAGVDGDLDRDSLAADVVAEVA